MLGKLFAKRPDPAPAPEYTIRTVYDMFPAIDDLRRPADHPDLDDASFWEVVDEVKPYTMLGVEALYSIKTAVDHVARDGVAGDFVECGVFLGGAVLAAARFAWEAGLRDRRFHLYDTFAGFPQGTAPETDCHGALVPLQAHPSFLAATREVIARAPFPADHFEFVEGEVARTLREAVPDRIAVLRLDTDDYASIRAELEALYPRLSSGGVLLLDDYGLFRGVRRATDEFLETQERRPLLHRVSFGIRAGIKP